MRKFLLTSVLFVSILIVGCGDNPVAPDKAPSVTYDAIENGTKLRLTWTALSDVDGYYVYLDGVKAEPDLKPEETSCDIVDPVQEIEVCGFSGEEEGPRWSLDLTPKESSTTIYGASDPSPDNPSGLGFDANGGTHTYPLSKDTLTGWPKIDFYIEDRGGINMSLFAPSDVPAGVFPGHPLNAEENLSLGCTSTAEFDSLDAAEGGSYSTQTELADGGLYSIWIEKGEDDKAHFGKLKVTAISGTKVDITVAYQKIEGLKWIVTK